MKLQDRIEWNTSDTRILIGMLLWTSALLFILPYDSVFYRGDSLLIMALEHATRTAIKQGQWPLWNPYFMEPLLANPQSMVLYPTHLLLRFLPMEWFFPVQSVLHVWLVGAALYLLLRHWNFSRAASLTGASAVAFSTLVFSQVVAGHITPLPVFGWSILILLFYGRLLHYGRFKDFLLTVGATISLYLSGHTQISVIGLLLAASYFVYYLTQERSWKAALQALKHTALVGLFSAGILAVPLLLTLEYFPETIRTFGFSFSESALYSLNLVTIFNVFLPFGTLETAGSVSVAQENLFYTTVTFLGAALIAFKFSPQERRPLIRYVSIVAVVALLLALGEHTPLFKILYFMATFFRVPGRFLFFWTLPASVWIATGIDALAQPGQFEEKKRALWLGLGVPIMTIVAVIVTWPYRGIQESGPSDFISIIITASMIVIAFVVLEVRPKLSDQVWLRTLIMFIVLDASIHSAYIALWPPYYEKFPKLLPLDQSFACLSKQVDLSDGRFYSEDLTTMSTVTASAANGILSYQTYSANLSYTRDLFGSDTNGRYLLRASLHASNDDIPTRETQELFTTDCGLIVYKEKDVLPHVYAVNHLNVVDDEDRETSLKMIQDPAFDPLESAVISLPGGSAVPELAENDNLQYEAQIAEYTSNKIVIDVTTSQPALLVVSEVFYPGWRAVIDGEPSQIYRVNHGLQGIFISEGEQRITISFRPESVQKGLMISIISLIGLVPVGMLWKKQDKQEIRPTAPNAAASQGGGQR